MTNSIRAAGMFLAASLVPFASIELLAQSAGSPAAIQTPGARQAYDSALFLALAGGRSVRFVEDDRLRSPARAPVRWSTTSAQPGVVYSRLPTVE